MAGTRDEIRWVDDVCVIVCAVVIQDGQVTSITFAGYDQDIVAIPRGEEVDFYVPGSQEDIDSIGEMGQAMRQVAQEIISSYASEELVS